jgi:hypothetical protein
MFRGIRSFEWQINLRCARMVRHQVSYSRVLSLLAFHIVKRRETKKKRYLRIIVKRFLQDYYFYLCLLQHTDNAALVLKPVLLTCILV